MPPKEECTQQSHKMAVENYISALEQDTVFWQW